MKKTALVFAMLLTATAVMEAKTPASLAIIVHSSSNYEIIYSAAEKATVKIILADECGNRLSTRIVHNIGNFKLPVVLQGLSPGKYYVIVDNGKDVMKKELSFMQPCPIYSHVAKLSDDRYLVAISNAGASHRISISVYDGLSNLMQTLNLTVHGQKAVVVNTQNVNGSPTFKVSGPSGLSEVFQNLE